MFLPYYPRLGSLQLFRMNFTIVPPEFSLIDMGNATMIEKGNHFVIIVVVFHFSIWFLSGFYPSTHS